MWILVDWAETQFIGPFKTKDEATDWFAEYCKKHGRTYEGNDSDWEISFHELKSPETAVMGLEPL